MCGPICAILPRLIELAALGIVQLHSQVLEKHTISASSCFLFEKKLPAFALSSGFFLHLLLLRIGKVSTLSFCVLCKWRELASRNVNQCKSIMEAICEVCEEWQNSLGTYKQLHKYTHSDTPPAPFAIIGVNELDFDALKASFGLVLKVNVTLMVRRLCVQATDDRERQKDWSWELEERRMDYKWISKKVTDKDGVKKV